MAMAEKVRILLIKKHSSLKTLSEQLGCTPQNLSGKLRRDNFSEKELIEIASALGCRYEGRFVMDDTGEVI